MLFAAAASWLLAPIADSHNQSSYCAMLANGTKDPGTALQSQPRLVSPSHLMLDQL